jgi:hypothetical protein
MSYLILPSRSTRQPQLPARIDWSNPLTRGLVLAGCGSVPALDFVTRKSYSLVNATALATQDGIAASLSGSGSGITLGNVPQLNFGAADYALWVQFIPRGQAGTNREQVFSLDGTSTRSFTCELNTARSNGTSPGESGSIAMAHFSSAGIAINSTPARLFVNGRIGSFVGGRSGNSHVIFVDGVQQSLNPILTTWGSMNFGSENAYIGRRAYGGSEEYLQGDILAWGVFNGVAPYAELAKALNANPWQLFERAPRRLWFAPSGGGTGTVDGVGSAAGVGSAGAAGASLFDGVASSAGTGSAGAVGASLFSGVGSAAGVGTADAVGDSTAEGAGVGSAAGVGAASGVGASLYAGIGTAAGISVATGVGAYTGTVDAVGSAAGVGAASGVGAYLATLSAAGSAAGVGSALAVGTFAGASIWTDITSTTTTWTDL